MRLMYHGAFCCGVKTIYLSGLVDGTSIVSAETLPNVYQTDGIGSAGKIFYKGKRPAETAIERFDAYLEYVDGQRTGGIIEVVLMVNPANYASQHRWIPLLRKRGFKKTTDCYNSNSANRVVIFHRKKDDPSRVTWKSVLAKLSKKKG